MTNQPHYRFTARLTAESKNTLRTLASATGVNMSEVLRYLIESIPEELIEKIVFSRTHPEIWGCLDQILESKESKIAKRRQLLGLDNWPQP